MLGYIDMDLLFSNLCSLNYVAKQNVGDENQIRSKASKRKLEKNLLLDPVSKKEAKRKEKKRERGKGGKGRKGEKEQPGCVQIKKLTQNQRHLVTLKELSLMWPIVQVMVFFHL